MNKLLKYTLLFAVVAATSTAAANVFDTVGMRMVAAFDNVKLIIFIVGAFCLIGAGAMAMFGKLKWSWFWMLAFGLAVVAVAGGLVNWVVSEPTGPDGDALNSGLPGSDTWGTTGG